MLLASYEAEQHLLHLGRADSPVAPSVPAFSSRVLLMWSVIRPFQGALSGVATGAPAGGAARRGLPTALIIGLPAAFPRI